MFKFVIDKYASDGENPIQRIEILKETEKTYVVQREGWNKKIVEDRVYKTTKPIYETFDEAKAEYIRQRQYSVERIKAEVARQQNALIKAEALLAAAPSLVEAPRDPA